MAYQVLARKYRPEKFQEVIGQDHVTQTLLNAFARDRIAHAYLFAGPRGVGKTTTARILAKALNCLKNDDGNPCDECQNCTEIAASRSMDVLEIDGASNRGIDEIRNLRELVRYPPINAESKVFIIDEVHMLTPQAFNALLKTLEEPPPHVMFVFATTEPNKVLPTILSRCQRHDFHRLSMDDILKGMKLAVESEGISIDEKTGQVVARMADGSMRDALSLLDQIVAFCGNDISLEEVSTLLGIIPNSLYFDVTDAIKGKDRKNLLHLMQDVYSQGYSLNDFVSGLSQHFLNFLVCKAESGQELLDMTGEMLERYGNESDVWDAKDLLRYIDQVTEMESKLRIVQQPKIYVETMMLKLLEMDSTVTISEIISRISGGSGHHQQPESVGEQRELFNAAEAAETEKSTARKKGGESAESENDSGSQLFEKIQKRWDEIVSRVSENGTSVGMFLGEGSPSQLNGKRLIISCPRKSKFQSDFLKKNTRMIESTVEEVIGESLRIEYVVSKETPNQEDVASEETHPVAKRMLELFGGKIVE